MSFRELYLMNLEDKGLYEPYLSFSRLMITVWMLQRTRKPNMWNTFDDYGEYTEKYHE